MEAPSSPLTREPRPPLPSRRRRSRPPSQDRLVAVFAAATVVFTLIAISPFFLVGELSSSHSSSSSDSSFPAAAHDVASMRGVRLAGLGRRNGEREHDVVVSEENDGGTANDGGRGGGGGGGGRGGGAGNAGKRIWSRANSTIAAVEDPRGRTQAYVPISADGRPRPGGSLGLDRGVSGLPSSMTPALVGARRGSIRCPDDVVGDDEEEEEEEDGGDRRNVDELAYWNDPQGESDVSFVSPFDPRCNRRPDDDNDEKMESRESRRRYVTFEPDRGGWNNIRMSLEIVMVFAAATGRTLVLPPDTPFYLLSKDGGGGAKGAGKKRHHGFADFLDLESPALRRQLDMMSMTEFLEREGGGGGGGTTAAGDGMFELPGGSEGSKILMSAEQCYYVAKSDRPCDAVYDFLRSHAHVPDIQAGRDCLIFDSSPHPGGGGIHVGISGGGGYGNLPDDAARRKVDDFCDGRNPVFFRDSELASARLVHFHAGEKEHRLLNHFYTFLHFTDVRVDHHYKRFVRDFLHYPDEVWCAASRVIRSLEEESAKLSSGGGEPSYSSMHVRRGDFQYKKVKITAQDWHDNTRELFRDNELIYVATDEKTNKFFEPLAKHYNLRFLSDFTVSAGLDKLDPNLMGMIDSIVASRGRLFVGTWFSTFTGYIVSLFAYLRVHVATFSSSSSCDC